MSSESQPSPVSEQKLSLPPPGPGTERTITVLTYGEANARPKFYIQTALHADEIPGMVLVHHLRRYLDLAAGEGRIKGHITLVPVANPIGMSQRIQGNVSGRLDLNNGKNYNRAYPDLLPGVASRIENQLGNDAQKNVALIRQAIAEEINALPEIAEGDAYRKRLLSLCSDSDYCIDIHCDNEALLYLYTGGTHPQQEAILSAYLGCQMHLVDSSSSMCFDGAISLLWLKISRKYDAFPIPLSCFGSTLEMRGTRDVSDEFGKSDARNLYNFLVHQGAVVDKPVAVPEALCSATPIEAQIYISSPCNGIVIYRKECGDQVQKDEVVAEILDPLAKPEHARTQVTSGITGQVMSRSDQRLVGPGQHIMAIVGKEIVPDRVGSHLLSD